MSLRRLALWHLFLLAILLLPGAGCTVALGPVTRVVLITLDTTRADRLGCYGYDRAQTPHLDRFANENVLFERAVSTVPTTLPAHGTIFTGLYPQDHGLRYNLIFRLRPEAVTLAELLGEAGFATAAFPSSFVLSSDSGIHQGFQTWAEPEKVTQTTPNSQALLSRSAEQVVDLAVEWLDDHADEKGFLWAHFYDPHAPYRPPFPYSSHYRDRPYDGELAYTDAQVGRLLERLRADPLWDRTLVVISGDHGEGLHEHKERWHANLVYETTQHVPLMLRAPGARAARVEEPVGIADIMPTVLESVGVGLPPNLRGSSLRPALQGRRPPRRAIYFETLAGALNYGWSELKGVRFGRWKLIDSKLPELFDLDQDPSEQNNLAAFEPRTLEDLRAQLNELAGAVTTEELAADAQGSLIDATAERLLASLGYVAGGFGSSSAEAPHPGGLIDLEGDLGRGQSAVAQRDWTTVEEISRYLLERNPTNKWALRVLTDALVVQERLPEAEEAAVRLLEAYPDQAVGYATLADVLRRRERPKEAYETLVVGRQAVTDSERLAYLAIVAGFDLERPVCDEDLPATMAEFPKSALLMVLRARCESREGQPEAAFQTLVQAVLAGFKQVELLAQAEEFSDLAANPQQFDVLRGLAGVEGAPEVKFFSGRKIPDEEDTEKRD